MNGSANPFQSPQTQTAEPDSPRGLTVLDWVICLLMIGTTSVLAGIDLVNWQTGICMLGPPILYLLLTLQAMMAGCRGLRRRGLLQNVLVSILISLMTMFGATIFLASICNPMLENIGFFIIPIGPHEPPEPSAEQRVHAAIAAGVCTALVGLFVFIGVYAAVRIFNSWEKQRVTFKLKNRADK